MTEPIQIPNKLAGNPTQEPQFQLMVKTSDGQSLPVADPRATRAMIALMDMNAVLGGAASHYGGPAALAELMSALHGYVFLEAKNNSKPWYELFHLINDAGHCENGLYALKANYRMAGLEINSLKKFRSIESGLTGHGEVHCFPEGVLLSNGPLASSIPQAQGLAMGDALAHRNRVTVSIVSDGACMEGEAKEAFAAIPGLASMGKLAPFVMIISDNNTKLTGRIDKDSFSMQPTFSAMKNLGWNVLELDNGHDLQKCFDLIVKAVGMAKANPKAPVAIHARTIKGIGTKKTAESSSGGHGFPLKSPTELAAFISEIYNGEKYPEIFNQWIGEALQLEQNIKAKASKETGEKIQKGISSAMIRARKDGYPVISVTSDLPGSTGVAEFRKEFPADSIDVGIAESNMISAAAGMSKVGYIPVVDTFAQFGVTKGALPFIMASLSEAPMIAVFSHTGFQDAADGASHQALSYLAMVSSIPHVKAYCLTCSEEADALMYQAIADFKKAFQSGQTPDSVIFFLGRENFPKNFVPGMKYQLGQAQIISDNSSQFPESIALAAGGSMVGEALIAADKLAEKKIGTIVVNPSCMNNVDVKTMSLVLQKTKGRLVTIEDHQVIGGMGQMLSHALLMQGLTFKVKSLGVKAQFGQSAYTAMDLYKKHGLDAVSIVHQAQTLI